MFKIPRILDGMVSDGILRGIFDKKAFTKDQEAQIHCLQNAYSRSIGDPIHSLLSVQEKENKIYAACTPLASNFRLGVWIQQMGDTFPRIYVEDMVTIICSYQESRHYAIAKKSSEAWFRNDYLDEPVQLFCEEFKDWLVTELSQANCSNDTLGKVKKRISYLEQLIAAKEFFPTYPACGEEPKGALGLAINSMTIFRVLVEIHQKLIMCVKPVIESEIAHASAREHVKPMMHFSKQAVHHGIAYLFYVLNEKPLRDDFTLDNIRRHDTAGYREYADTSAGKVLSQLVGLVDVHVASGQAFSDSLHVQDEGFKNPFLLHAEESALRSKSFESPESGLNRKLKDKKLSDLFIFSHTLLAEFIYLEKFWQTVYQLSGLGGNILVYGIANKEINALLTGTESLIRTIKTVLNELHSIANDHYILLYRRNTADEKIWRINFRVALVYYKLLVQDLNDFHETVQKVRVETNAISIEKRLIRAQEGVDELAKRVAYQAARINAITASSVREVDGLSSSRLGSQSTGLLEAGIFQVKVDADVPLRAPAKLLAAKK